MHSCHNRLCINPDHLSLGTGKDNMQSSIAAGRRVGRKRTFKEEIIKEVLALRDVGYSYSEIAEQTGISPGHVPGLIRRERKIDRSHPLEVRGDI